MVAPAPSPALVEARSYVVQPSRAASEWYRIAEGPERGEVVHRSATHACPSCIDGKAPGSGGLGFRPCVACHGSGRLLGAEAHVWPIRVEPVEAGAGRDGVSQPPELSTGAVAPAPPSRQEVSAAASPR